MSKADIIIDDTDTGAIFVSTTGSGMVRFSIAIKGEDTVAEVDLTPERAEDIARMVMEVVRTVRPTGAYGGAAGVVGPISGGGGGTSWS